MKAHSLYIGLHSLELPQCVPVKPKRSMLPGRVLFRALVQIGALLLLKKSVLFNSADSIRRRDFYGSIISIALD